MTKLFQTKAVELKRTKRMPVLWTPAEYLIVEEAARARLLTPSEFVRRAALGRKTDVRYEKEIVLALLKISAEISRLHNESVAKGLNPQKELLEPLVEQAIAAMLRIEK